MMAAIFPYAATTRGITVRVAPAYLPEQSDADAPRHVWSYHVRVENGGPAPVQLLSRRWVITDGAGRSEIVEGEGVVGEQPVIAPGGAFDYMSGCPLATSSGTMHGHYVIAGENGRFEAEIPAFALEHPSLKPSLN